MSPSACALAFAVFLLSAQLPIRAAAQNLSAPSRIVERIDDSRRVVLTGNTHPLARPEFDRGPAPDSLPLNRMLLVLQSSEAQNAELETLLAEQQDPNSPNYHAWLTPQEFGARFGLGAADLERVSNWLKSHGFRVNRISNGQNLIEFSGTAGQLREAFHTEIHKFAISPADPSGKIEHWANNRDPEIPAALAPVVAGIGTLNDFGLHAMHKTFGLVTRHAGSAEVTPQFSVTLNGNPYYGLAPYDFATLYNVVPLWNAGITGAGETIAIPGQTDIRLSDVAAFRKAFGLPANAPKITLDGADPGIQPDDEEESDLDVEWSGAVARGATIDFVTAASTNTTPGVVLSTTYAVDQNLAHILSLSYGACEEQLGTAYNTEFNNLWKQAAGEGMTVFVATGDSGSAGCDKHGQNTPYAAEYGLAVNGFASTPYNVAVGGTDLADYNPVGPTNTFSTYWSSTNNSTTQASLLKYVPETVWNDTCTILNEAACNNSANNAFISVNGGSGGKSSCTILNSATNTCSGGYAKPTWQAGTGVPADGKRDIPDVSLYAGDGVRHSFYLLCDTDATATANGGDGACNYSSQNDVILLAVGGTSASSPAMAGIQAMINQKANAAQGNINPTLYSLFAKESLSGCNSTNGSGSACIFNDITNGTNAMPCYAGTANCTVSTSGDEYGILGGYTSTTGYDLASGLGSVNANNLVNAWPGSAAPKVTLSATSEAFGSQSAGTTSAVKTVTLTNSGTAALTGIAISVAGTNPTDFVQTNTCGTTLAAAADCTITLSFKPAAAAAYSATVDIKDNATGSPQTIALTGTGTAAVPAVTLSETKVAFANQAKGTTSAATVVTLTNSGSAALTGLAISLTGTNPTDFAETTTCTATLAAAAKCTISLTFKPAAAAAYSATVDIKDNAAGSPQTIALTGTGITPAPAVTLSETKVAFANQAKGTTSAATVVTLTNSGTAALTGIAISLAGTNPTDFAETTTCAATLAAAAKCTISLTFKPAAAAAYAATVDVKDNASGSPQTIALTGTGYTPAPAVTLSETKVAFANQAKGTTSAATVVTLTNSGTAALTGITISLTGTNPTDFTESTTCTATLAVAAKCTLSLTFKPAAAAAYAATVDIKDNAAGSPQTIALTGTGITPAPAVTLSATSEAFGNQVIATTSAAKTVTLTNSGNAALSSIAISVAGTNPTDFVETNTCGTTIAAAAKCTITLSFKPAAVASYSATVDIKDNATGSPQTIALTGAGIANPNAGTIISYAGDGQGGYTGDNGPATSARLYYGHGTVEDAAGNVYIADEGNNVVRKVNASTGVITTYAGDGYGAEMNPGGFSGDGGPATKAELGGPNGLAIDKSGNLYIADLYNSVIRKVTASTGIITTVAGMGGQAGYTGDGGKATAAELFWPKGVAVDASGNLYISDSANHVIRKVTASTGIITTIVGGTGGGCAAETDASGDGCPANDAYLETSEGVAGTGGLAVDSAGNLFFADSDIETVREVHASTGIITAVAGNGNAVSGYSGDNGPASKSELNYPTDVKLDGAGNIYIADSLNNIIRKVTASSGVITTIAGKQYTSGGGKEFNPVPFTSPTSVTFNTPGNISIDPSGNLFISDFNNFVVDKVYSIATPLPLP